MKRIPFCESSWFNHLFVKLLVIGGGGREHALVWKMAQSSWVTDIAVAPGNAGTAQERILKSGRMVKNLPLSAEDIDGLLDYANTKMPNLTVVGPDNPLALGIVDRFQSAGHRIWGPNQKAAQFEWSKIFSQSFMERYGIPTARAQSFCDADSAKSFVRELGGQCVVKADGLALGKGVMICQDQNEAEQAITRILEERIFGDAGNRILIQEYLFGKELSLHAFCDGKSYRLFPISQDYKRAQDGDAGPNTGGMGAHSPAIEMDEKILKEARARILDPWLSGCQEEGIDYRGVLYPGLILTKEGLKVLEFNARFGDPEAQVYLRRLKTDLVEIMQSTMDGSLSSMDIEWSEAASLCIVIASGGYPQMYEKGKTISGIEAAERIESIKVFHAGTTQIGDAIVTSGGRVLAISAMSETMKVSKKFEDSNVSNVSKSSKDSKDSKKFEGSEISKVSKDSKSLKKFGDSKILESSKFSKKFEDLKRLKRVEDSERFEDSKRLEEARAYAYEAALCIDFEGARFRSDIASHSTSHSS